MRAPGKEIVVNSVLVTGGDMLGFTIPLGQAPRGKLSSKEDPGVPLGFPPSFTVFRIWSSPDDIRLSCRSQLTFRL